jgi:uncharacterized membrane protein YphA (DoxX/SURF4 family)/glutaredoxin
MKIKNIPFRLIRILSILLGIVYLVSGIAKAADINAFVDNITQYGSPSLRMVAPIIVGIEIIIGFALIVWQKPKAIAQISFWLLIFFTTIFTYGYFVNGISDCGCFGDVIKMSPMVSFTRNILMISVSGLIWYYLTLNPASHTSSKLYLGVIYGLGFVSFFSTGFEMKTTYTVVQKIESLPVAKTIIGRSIVLPKVDKCLIFIYSPKCPHCQAATSLINRYQKNGLVDTTIALTASELKISEISNFYKKFNPEFQTFQIPKDSLKKITRTLPMVVYIEKGIVKKVMTEGVMTPKEFSDSMKMN